ncbi:MAG: orotate phosphoribosyltransferase [Rhodospirillales bacterium]|nr:orotate phosphoribosyltransferase [Rhodospirillales bacterium]MBO6786915.1 orotate phosphoribosyltransferase [Rhodospirillales bacterium]
MSDSITQTTARGMETARLLLDIKAVNFRPQEPYMLTAGWASPVYIDCRWVISFLDARRRIIEMGAEMLSEGIDMSSVDFMAGGETAGIPYSSWLSESLSKPMLYVRKKPKGFGRGAQIEGSMPEGAKVILVEDLATDGGSKVNFVNALRDAGATVEDIFVVFFYGAFPGAEETFAGMGVKLHYLATWQDVLAEATNGGDFPQESLDGVRAFLDDPIKWSADHSGRDKL